MTPAEASDDALQCDFDAFAKVARTRRSVRAYLPDPIPDDVLDKAMPKNYCFIS